MQLEVTLLVMNDAKAALETGLLFVLVMLCRT